MKKVLIIQTSYLGDVILATPLIEKLKRKYPSLKIDFLLRKGNENLLKNHPLLNELIIWDKQKNKYQHLKKVSQQVHKNHYDAVFNLHRFASSGLITAFSGAKHKIGFDKNPLSFLYTVKVKHDLENNKHEVERNIALLKGFTDTLLERPALYPSVNDYKKMESYTTNPFICIAPGSVWFTKQLPKEKWVELVNLTHFSYTIIFIGSTNDSSLSEKIISESQPKKFINLCGKISLLESAALMHKAKMNYVNDSAPLHIASAMNTPVTAFFCSTLPSFGFGPLSDNRNIAEISTTLPCRPCGLHGKAECPEKHFKCGKEINIKGFALVHNAS
ncbi:MAG: glycosyltransferase family 9 protein [Flavobacteriales bacterium]|nr:glycosyltransferase family 9 protein [Flavobacteriales bacterium]